MRKTDIVLDVMLTGHYYIVEQKNIILYTLDIDRQIIPLRLIGLLEWIYVYFRFNDFNFGIPVSNTVEVNPIFCSSFD